MSAPTADDRLAVAKASGQWAEVHPGHLRAHARLAVRENTVDNAVIVTIPLENISPPDVGDDSLLHSDRGRHTAEATRPPPANRAYFIFTIGSPSSTHVLRTSPTTEAFAALAASPVVIPGA